MQTYFFIFILKYKVECLIYVTKQIFKISKQVKENNDASYKMKHDKSFILDR